MWGTAALVATAARQLGIHSVSEQCKLIKRLVRFMEDA